MIPPPTDPDRGWPAYLTPENAARAIVLGLEGFSYPALDPRWETGRLTFTISPWSPWRQWCQLQRHVYPSSLATTRYACIPDGYVKQSADGSCYVALTQDATTGEPVSCVKGFPLCIGTPAICTCDAAGCNAVDLPIPFELILGEGIGDCRTNLNGSNTIIRLTQASRR